MKKIFVNKSFGRISSIFLITYGLMRFIIEYTREPDSHIGLFLNYFSMGQILCIPMILFGLIVYQLSNNEKFKRKNYK